MQTMLSLWTNIRGTVRDVIDNKTIGAAILFIILGGIGSTFAGLADSDLNEDLSNGAVLLIGIFGGAILVIVGHTFFTLVVFLFGKLFKGTGSYGQIFKALSVAYIPYIIFIPFLLIWMAIDPTAYFSSSYDSNFVVEIIFAIVLIGISIFCLVVEVIAVSEVHQFGIWKAIATIFIPGIILFVIVFVIVIIILVAVMGVVSEF